MKLKPQVLFGVLALVCSAFSPALFASALDELNMGLSKTSVFDDPTPPVAHYSDIKPGKSDRNPTSYHTAPPQITHRVEEYLPITAEENQCTDCHDKRKQIGKEWKKGKKVPMPDNHYGTFNKPGGVEDVAGARYNCTLCHAQQSDAPPLVGSTFK